MNVCKKILLLKINILNISYVFCVFWCCILKYFRFFINDLMYELFYVKSIIYYCFVNWFCFSC